MIQYYRIAGIVVAMDSFGRTVKQAIPYRIEHEACPDIVVKSNLHRVKADCPHLSDDDCEYLGTCSSFYRHLLYHDGCMVHSSAIVVDGKAYLFSADPGTGKSTHTSLWLELFGDRAFILNDDKPAVRLIDGIWYAFGTPWSGKHDISVNTGVPIAGIAVLERGDKNEIEPFTGKDAVLSVLRQVNRPKAAELRIKLLELLDKMITEVPVWKLKCNMKPEAAIVAYEAMSGKKWEETK